MFHPRDAGDRLHEVPPVVALRREHLPSLPGEPVETPPAGARLLDPPALEPAALLEAVEERVEGSDVEAEAALGAVLDELADLVPVARARLEEGEDEQLRRALLELAVEHASQDIRHSHICYAQWCREATARSRGSVLLGEEGGRALEQPLHEAAAPPLLGLDLLRAREVLAEGLLHLRAEAGVEDADHVLL